MPRLRIVILDKPDPLNTNVYQYLFWADVPTARQRYYANPNAVSRWLDAIQADTDALKSGAMVEQVSTVQVAQGTGMPAVQAHLETLWTNYQAQITASNPWQRYGSTFDGTTWVVKNSA